MLETNIGIEIHVEIATKTKAFCGCPNEFGAMPNTLVCPTCLGLPGSVPSVNRHALELTIKSGLLLGSTIAHETSFERKNYFYPDLPKGYQIVQLTQPICLGGRIVLSSGKEVKLNRVHLEENTAKLIHDGDSTKIDFNRSGTPILEIVSNPTPLDAQDVVEYISKVKTILMFGGISSCKLEEGKFKFDINLSLKKKDSSELGVRVELINLTSSADIEKSIAYEIERQTALIESSQEITKETRMWDSDLEKTYSVREKGVISDYRHFVDPDIKKIKITNEDIERLRLELPETYEQRVSRYIRLGLSDSQIAQITIEKSISDLFDRTCELGCSVIDTFNWITTEVFRVYREQNKINFENIIRPEDLKEIINLVTDGKVSRSNAKLLFDEIVSSGKSASVLIKELEIIGDVSDVDIRDAVEQIIIYNPNIIEDYNENKVEVINFFVGQILNLTGGRAHPDKIQKIVKDRMGS